MAVAYLAGRLTHTDYIRADEVLGRLRTHATRCALGIDRLDQHAAAIELLENQEGLLRTSPRTPVLI